MILDNDFRNPDVDRYLDRFETYDPSVAILGDAYTPQEARALSDLGQQLTDDHPYKTVVVVPKCHAALDIIADDVVLGYAMGFSDVQAEDFTDLNEWRARRVHLLGASPPKQYEVIEQLTQPTLTEEPPAEIVGLDWNGVQKVAYKGEYWTRDGWQPADHLSVRETVRTSLREIKRFWQDHGVWPATEPIDLYGPAVHEPADPLYAVNATDITAREQLEAAIIVDYEAYGPLAFRTETERAWFEYSEGLPNFWSR